MRTRTDETYLRFDRPLRAPKRRPPRPRTPLARDFAATAARPARGTFSISSHFRGLSVARRCCRHRGVRQRVPIYYYYRNGCTRAERRTTTLFTLNITDTTRNNYTTRSATEIILFFFRICCSGRDNIIIIVERLRGLTVCAVTRTRSHGIRFTTDSTAFTARDGVQTTTDDGQNRGRSRGAVGPASQPPPPPPPPLARDRSSTEDNARTTTTTTTTAVHASRRVSPHND